MRIIIAILPLLLLMGCEGHYRYPCQDPANWGKIECNNDVCKAEGTCTADVIAPAGSRTFGFRPEVDSGIVEEEISLEDDENNISNSGCAEPVAKTPVKLSYRESSDDRIFNVKNRMMLPPPEEMVDSENDEGIARDPLTLEEPLIMNSIVNTAEHNAATR